MAGMGLDLAAARTAAPAAAEAPARRMQGSLVQVESPRGGGFLAPPPLLPPVQLPEGWEVLTDAEGDNYYFNSRTGETSWSAPTPAQPSPRVPLPVGGARPPPPAASAPPPPADAPLPAGWEALTDEDGDVYYHNEATGAVSWDRPT